MKPTKLTRDSRCPLCGGEMTDYYRSEGRDAKLIHYPIEANVCIHRSCGLPVRLWLRVAALANGCRAALNVEEQIQPHDTTKGRNERLCELLREALKGCESQ